MGVSINKTNVNEKGELSEWMPATPLGMKCEHKNCESAIGKDYIRLPEEDEEGWEGEPVFLCDEHGKGHTLLGA